ncbi:NAD-dependent epimerase [Actinoplanes sp. LDG1-06]|uniref:NAD-dependent epimerase n=1 Tax=Paractinoplanes ovalisporus TaxID=2810368 RepID=A0ABS2AU74_9ACTN|nr:NAD-dependent epimerase/dehydratase family protein [Actinoplanes ovalisporus]MBM2623428.1 NAD-dependent epimerase [Actinoplanes ovalisporus]
MRLLILGGSWFLGRALAERALASGWTVTTFNRGESRSDLPGVQAVRGNRERPEDFQRLAEHGPWDAVVDTIGFVPDQVLAAATALEPAAQQYVFVSSVNAYVGWPNEPLDEASQLFECPPDAGAGYGSELGYAGQYGALKAGCERAAEVVFGSSRTTVLRPSVILGPEEYVGRLTWWLARAARGGELLAPAPAQQGMQPIDVRDVAAFLALCAVDRKPGAFNVAAPIGHASFAALIESCIDATKADTRPVWVDPDWLIQQGVEQWTELPLWRTQKGVWAVNTSRAQSAGLRCRALSDTVFDTWAWMTRGGAAVRGEGEASRAADHGLSPEREAELLRTWHRPAL